MDKGRTYNTQNYFEKKNEVGGLNPPELQTYLKAASKACGITPQLAVKVNRADPETDPNIYSQSISNNGALASRGGRVSLSIRRATTG